MYKHLLIPTDGSQRSRRAIKAAVALANALGAKVTGVCAVPTYHREWYGAAVPPTFATKSAYEAQARKIAEAHLAVVKKEAAAAKIPCTTCVALNDSPHAAILDAARKTRCDAIFMASHGRRGISRILLGSETQKVLSHSRIPVIVYR